MDKAQGIKEKVKKVFASPIYSTIVLVPLLIVVILVSAAVFMVVERTKYYDAVYYIITLVTTIGYGNYTPYTTGGKILTIFYIVLFVPLAMITIAKAGQLLNLLSKYLWIALCGCLGKKNTLRKVENVSIPLIIPLLILLIYILVGSAIFLVLEEQQRDITYFEMLYFVFVSLSTIGFGDIFPINKDSFPFLVFYMFGGLIIIAMCINIAFFDSVNNEIVQKNENEQTTTQNEENVRQVAKDVMLLQEQ